ncbi:MAG: MFS transporter [Rhodanobacteraceae bacterium]
MISQRYRVILLCAALTALNQFEWLRLAPITSQTVGQYGVKPSDVGNLSVLFSGLFILLGLPAGTLIDRISVRATLRTSAILMVVGTAARCIAPTYRWLVAGTVLLAIAQPVVMGVLGKLVLTWFDPAEHTKATSIGSMAIFIGVGLAFTLIPLMAGYSIYFTLFIDVIASCMLALVTFLAVPYDESSSMGTVSSAANIPKRTGLKILWRSPLFMTLILLIFLSNGYFNALFTWLSPILVARHFDTQRAGVVALSTLIGGVLAISLVPMVTRWAHINSRRFVCMVIGCAVPLTMAMFLVNSFLVLCIVMFLLGGALLSSLPILIRLVIDSAGSNHAGIAMSVFWLVGAVGATALTSTIGALADAGAWRYMAMVFGVTLVIEFWIAIAFLPKSSKAEAGVT